MMSHILSVSSVDGVFYFVYKRNHYLNGGICNGFQWYGGIACLHVAMDYDVYLLQYVAVHILHYGVYLLNYDALVINKNH